MKHVRRSCSAFIFLGLCAGLASTAAAQSTVRISGLEGRQLSWGLQPIAVSQDGQRLLVSGPDGLFVGDDNGYIDLTWFDTRTGAHQRAVAGPGGVPPDGDVSLGVLSANERFLVCTTNASNLAPGDTNGIADGYVLDQQTGALIRATLGSNGAEPTSECIGRGVSDDGRYVVFESEDDGLVPNDANMTMDVFVRDVVLNTTRLVSVSLAGTSGDGYEQAGSISADGRYVAFLGQATDLVAGDTNGFADVFVRDLVLNTTTRVSVGSSGVQGDDNCFDVKMTPDARWVAFSSLATNLASRANAAGGIYVLDRTSGLVVNGASSAGQVTNGACGNPTIGHDGRFLAFQSTATNLDPRDTDGGYMDAYLCDLQLGTARLVSIATNGNQGTAPSSGYQLVTVPMTSADGQRVMYVSNLVGLVAGDTNDDTDAFLWDAGSTCPAIESYCTGKLNSQGCRPSITTSGEPRVAGPSDSFFVSATGLVGNQPGMFLWSLQPTAAPFFGGTLCLTAPVRRTPAQSSGGSAPPGCSGSYAFHFTQAYVAARNLPAGYAIFGQFWGRDNGLAPPNNVALTDAIAFTLWP